VSSGAGFLKLRVEGVKGLVCARKCELELPRFLFARDPARRPSLDEALAHTAAAIAKAKAEAQAPAAVRNQPLKRQRKTDRDETNKAAAVQARKKRR
jgi:hypothetical protein